MVSIILFFLQFVRLGLSVITLSLSAKFFGINIEKDIWVIAFSFITTVQLAIWGPLDETFRTKYVKIKETQGENISTQNAISLVTFSFIISSFIAFAIFVYSTNIAIFLAPSFDKIGISQLSIIIKLLAPTFILSQISRIWTSILNSHNIYYTPEVAGLFAGVASLLIMILLAPKVGIYSLVISTYISLIFLLGLLIVNLKKLNTNFFKFSTSALWTNSKPFIMFSVPFFFPFFFSQISGIIEKLIANKFGIGVVSIIDYSKKFSDIFTTVILGVSTSLMVPKLTKAFTNANNDECISEIRKNLQFGFLLLTIFIAYMTTSSLRLTSFLYLRGNMSNYAIDKIFKLNILYTWLTIPIFLYSIIGLALLSTGKEKLYAFFGIVAQLLIIIMNILLYNLFNVYTFFISTFLSCSFAALFMFNKLPLGKKIIQLTIIKYLIILFGATFFTFLFNIFFIQPANFIIYSILNLFVTSLFLLLIIFFFNLDEKELVKSIINKLKINRILNTYC